MKDEFIYPCTIIEDRYNGVYSGGVWTAWNKYKENVPDEIDDSDVPCANFWYNYKEIVGLGKTPHKAYKDLEKKLGKQ